MEKGKSPTLVQTMIVFVVSAFWHGFYPSYYVMFTVAAILSEVNKDIFKSRVLFQRSFWWPLRSVFGHVLNMICMNYLGIILCSLTLP